uniref:Uncharacterized protein n=1 Tax=Trypanosoma congolense (strain IL3000) TaxID=1068625 RepID=G0UUW0_TRYCI|nr:hypothetical protein, unlikely [Trypanosoma congolense IL3000]
MRVSKEAYNQLNQPLPRDIFLHVLKANVFNYNQWMEQRHKNRVDTREKPPPQHTISHASLAALSRHHHHLSLLLQSTSPVQPLQHSTRALPCGTRQFIMLRGATPQRTYSSERYARRKKETGGATHPRTKQEINCEKNE